MTYGAAETASRDALVRRGLVLNYATIGYNAVEAVLSILAGVIAGSVALIGFGLDSIIEVASGVAALWRLRSDVDAARRESAERAALKVIGLTFLALAAYVTYEGAKTLWMRELPSRSILGVVILVLSVIVMPWLSRKKRRVAQGLESRALEAEATQTSLCAYLSAIALAGVGLNAFFGVWWADPVAALAMVPIIAREGFEGLRVPAHVTGKRTSC